MQETRGKLMFPLRYHHMTKVHIFSVAYTMYLYETRYKSHQRLAQLNSHNLFNKCLYKLTPDVGSNWLHVCSSVPIFTLQC